jgi:hypothetical protein
MDLHDYQYTDKDGRTAYVRIAVESQDDHFVATSIPIDGDGRPLAEGAAMAPRFYGLTKSQALRRMTDALENSHEDLRPREAM